MWFSKYWVKIRARVCGFHKCPLSFILYIQGLYSEWNIQSLTIISRKYLIGGWINDLVWSNKDYTVSQYAMDYLLISVYNSSIKDRLKIWHLLNNDEQATVYNHFQKSELYHKNGDLRPWILSQEVYWKIRFLHLSTITE